LRSAPEARKIEAYLAAITGADLGGKTARKKAEQILKQLEACGGRS